jgi:type II secretory pathway pseudopilin PulG
MRSSFAATFRCARGGERGFTYVGLLVFVFILGLMLTVVARVWTTTEQREREIELIYIGHAYRMAISSYYAVGHRFPATLKDLLTDERFPVPKHHLRRLYADPMTGQADWTLIAIPTGGGITGVASSSRAAPIKRDGFDLIDASFKDAEHYSDWKFVYTGNRWGAGASLPGIPIATPPSPQPGSQPPTGPTTAPGVPLPPLKLVPSPSPPPSPPSDPGPN